MNYISKTFVRNLLEKISINSKNNFDNFLVDNNIHIHLSRLVPFVFLYWIIPLWLEEYSDLLNYSKLVLELYFIFLLVWIIRSFFNASKKFLKTLDSFKDKPIDSFVQVAMILVWFTAIIFIFSILTGKEVSTFLTAMGALSAVILLIFKDTILGFVASIQLSSNDLIRIGDWITMKQFGADGDVIEINLSSVKVQNFDKTITTIPTYKLISDSFINWRGMSDSKGRRIKRALLIKGSSIRFMEDKDLLELEEISLIKDYIKNIKLEIKEHNSKLDIVERLKVNGRNLTNIGLFRKYTDVDLEFRTKSLQLSPFITSKPMENIILAYSLMPEIMSSALDNKTPTIAKRIDVMKKLASKGWNIGLRFDPLIHGKNWKMLYQDLLEAVLNSLPLNSIHSVSFGALRFPKNMFKSITKLYPEEKLFSGPLSNNDGIVSYDYEIEEEMTSFCKDITINYVEKSKIFKCSV